jgi:hypothetical protein
MSSGDSRRVPPAQIKWVIHALQQYTPLVPKRAGKASKMRKHFPHNDITKIRSPLNIQKNSCLID